MEQEKKLTKNQRYEQSQKNKGFEKVTLWVPFDETDNVVLACELMRENSDLTINNLRSKKTGRMASLNR